MQKQGSGGNEIEFKADLGRLNLLSNHALTTCSWADAIFWKDFSGDASSLKTVMFSSTACDSHFANLK